MTGKSENLTVKKMVNEVQRMYVEVSQKVKEKDEEELFHKLIKNDTVVYAMAMCNTLQEYYDKAVQIEDKETAKELKEHIRKRYEEVKKVYTNFVLKGISEQIREYRAKAIELSKYYIKYGGIYELVDNDKCIEILRRYDQLSELGTRQRATFKNIKNKIDSRYEETGLSSKVHKSFTK